MVRRSRRTTRIGKLVELGRADAPVAAGLPRHDVDMVVRHVLAAVDAVVLEGEDPERRVGGEQGLRHVPRSRDDGRRLRVRQFQQCAAW